MRRTRTVQAVAAPVAPSSADSAEYRKQLAESYGFRKIGEPLPDNITLKDVMDTLPKKVNFSKNQLHHASNLPVLFSMKMVRYFRFFPLWATRGVSELTWIVADLQ